MEWRGRGLQTRWLPPRAHANHYATLPPMHRHHNVSLEVLGELSKDKHLIYTLLPEDSTPHTHLRWPQEGSLVVPGTPIMSALLSPSADSQECVVSTHALPPVRPSGKPSPTPRPGCLSAFHWPFALPELSCVLGGLPQGYPCLLCPRPRPVCTHGGCSVALACCRAPHVCPQQVDTHC